MFHRYNFGQTSLHAVFSQWAQKEIKRKCNEPGLIGAVAASSNLTQHTRNMQTDCANKKRSIKQQQKEQLQVCSVYRNY